MIKNDTCTNSESNDSSSLPLFYIVLAPLIAFIAVVGNLTVIILIFKRRRLHVMTNYFVVSLAAADFLVGLFLPTFLIACAFWSGCEITTYNMFFNLFTLASIANLFVMTVDRYLFIVHPLRYQTSAASCRLLAAMSASWIIPTLLSFSPLFWKFSSSEKVKNTAIKVHAFIVITAFELVPTVVMPAMYAHIFHTARKHARQVAAQRKQVQFNDACSQVLSERNTRLELTTAMGKKVSLQRNERERRPDSSSIAVLGAVIGFFVLCWSFDTVISFCSKLELCVINESLFRVSDLMIFFNSAINPLVYAFLKKDIKRELGITFCCTSSDFEWLLSLCCSQRFPLSSVKSAFEVFRHLSWKSINQSIKLSTDKCTFQFSPLSWFHGCLCCIFPPFVSSKRK